MSCNIQPLGRLKENSLSLFARVMDKTRIQQLLREDCSSELIIFNHLEKNTNSF
jgi:hypothetical protein